MRILRTRITNFRGLEDITFEFRGVANLIVGPNAVGKTTVLEAIRLVKAALSPRYYQETQQVLQSLGAVSGHPQFGVMSSDYSMLARDVERPIGVEIDVHLNEDESAKLPQLQEQVSLEILKGTIGRGEDQSEIALTQLLSGEEGRAQLHRIQEVVRERIKTLKGSPLLLHLEITPSFGLRGRDQIAQTLISALDRSLPPDKTLFTHFPADRALPAGETTVQIGPNESIAQIQSHIGQSPSKYGRLKQSIVNSVLLSGARTQTLEEDFREVFEHLLPGKSFKHISLTKSGSLKVVIEDAKTGQCFDIDSMSSGEKGVLLTFLLLKQTLNAGGIVLLDEPELHLNPAVCRKLLPFLVECILEPVSA